MCVNLTTFEPKRGSPEARGLRTRVSPKLGIRCLELLDARTSEEDRRPEVVVAFSCCLLLFIALGFALLLAGLVGVAVLSVVAELFLLCSLLTSISLVLHEDDDESDLTAVCFATRSA